MSLSVKIDWNKDGLFTEPGATVTSRVRSTVTAEYGRDQSTALAPTVSGRGSVTLDNRSKDYSPRYSLSPLYGLIKPARPVKITRTVGATTYVLGQFHTDDNPINPDIDSKTVTLALIDSLADFRGQTISTQLYRDLRTGEAIGKILDACGWSASLRDLDLGATIIPWWWEDGTDALEALEKIIRSEGPPALLTIGSNGEIIFRDRHHRLTRTESTTSQGTWRASGTVEPIMQKPFVYDEAWRNIINSATASVDVRTPQPITAVWTSDATITLSAGEQKLITASGDTPFYNAITPVAGTDYTAVSGTVTAALIRTSGASATIILTAGGAPAVITGLQLRATPVAVVSTVQVSAVDPQSITDYGSRSFPGDLPWCGPGDAQAVLSTAVALRAQPLPVVQVRFMIGINAAKSAQILARDLSDRVTLIETETGLNGDFFIESISHELTSEYDHSVTFGLEAVPTPVSPVFRFDTTGQGFNDGKFAPGIDDPATMFRFDDSTVGRRFDEGNFSS